MDKINDQLLDFIARSPTAFHAAETICTMLDAAGFQALREKDVWEIRPGGRYYTVRNGSSVIAFHVGEERDGLCFRIAAAHGDSPMFKLKSSPVFSGPEGYVRLNVEAYGGMIDSTWLDRPLGIAGRNQNSLLRRFNVSQCSTSTSYCRADGSVTPGCLTALRQTRNESRVLY